MKLSVSTNLGRVKNRPLLIWQQVADFRSDLSSFCPHLFDWGQPKSKTMEPLGFNRRQRQRRRLPLLNCHCKRGNDLYGRNSDWPPRDRQPNQPDFLSRAANFLISRPAFACVTLKQTHSELTDPLTYTSLSYLLSRISRLGSARLAPRVGQRD